MSGIYRVFHIYLRAVIQQALAVSASGRFLPSGQRARATPGGHTIAYNEFTEFANVPKCFGVQTGK